MGFVDLHVHSTRSDGTYEPKELVDYALEKGLTAIAITDHDTVDAIDEMVEYAKDKPIEIIPGIEYSTEYNKRDVHIVGLFINHKAPVFQEYLESFKQSRINRNHKLCTNLQSAGIDITYDALVEMFPNAVITRAHYGKYLLQKGYVKSINEAFDRYLGDHTKYFVHREKITPQQVIEVTLKAGGIPVLAHPTLYKLGKEQLEVLVATLKAQGLMGIETLYSTYTSRDERNIKSLAEKYELLQSGGSDFHGENKPGLDLAVGYGKLYIHEDILKNMKRVLNKNTKILFTDLDGTLLTNDKKLLNKTKQKIVEMLKNGHHLVLASGRPINSIMDVVRNTGLLDELKKIDVCKGNIYATAYNGAVLYDCVNETFLERYAISFDNVKELFRRAKEKNIHIQTYTDNKIVSVAEDKELAYYRRTVIMDYIVSNDLDNVLEKPPCKSIAISLDDRELLESFRKEIEESELGKDIVAAFSNNYYLEFYSKYAGKGKALVKLCEILNIPVENSVSAGDEENDISMIKAAGVGVAMKNGNPNLKECADYVTMCDNNNDGIAEIIEKFINI